jgi:hypothetical protein
LNRQDAKKNRNNNRTAKTAKHAKRFHIHIDIPAQMHISTFGELFMPVYGFCIFRMLSITSYAAFDAARAFLCAMAAIGQKPDIRLREEMGVDIG